MSFFMDLAPGDHVTRLLGGEVPMPMEVSEVSDTIITCTTPSAGPDVTWTFDRASGVEEDHELGWGVVFGITGSFLVDPTKVEA
jgi:hypothetical protein